MMLPDDQKKKGVISASLGNHALALCYHGKQLEIPVTVVRLRQKVKILIFHFKKIIKKSKSKNEPFCDRNPENFSQKIEI